MSSERVVAALAACVFSVVATISACAGTLEDPDRFRDAGGPAPASTDAGTTPATTCPPVETGILQVSCTAAGCHSATNPANGLDLASPDVLTRLSNKAATGGAGSLIVPGNPATSVLYEKLTATPPFGLRMPQGASLDDATIACVHDWIAAAH